MFLVKILSIWGYYSTVIILIYCLLNDILNKKKGGIKLSNRLNTRMMAEISMLLSLGFALKLVTDILTRTVASFLFIDFLLLMTVVIVYLYPKLKVVIIVAAIETVVSATLFTLTDMWFVRPIIVFIAFGVIRFVMKKNWKEQTKFVVACFLTSKLTIVAVSFILIAVLYIHPTLLGFDGILNQLQGYNSLISEEQLLFLEDNFEIIMTASLLLMALLYAYIPAFMHLFLGLAVFKILNKVKNKQSK